MRQACLYWQVFEELEEIGKTIQDDVLDAGMPVHGAMGGDISKCPYYTAKMGMHGNCIKTRINLWQWSYSSLFFCFWCFLCVAAASGGTAYVCQLAMAVLRHPTGQVLFATWFAALAGLAAWYLMWSRLCPDTLLWGVGGQGVLWQKDCKDRRKVQSDLGPFNSFIWTGS